MNLKKKLFHILIIFTMFVLLSSLTLATNNPWPPDPVSTYCVDYGYECTSCDLPTEWPCYDIALCENAQSPKPEYCTVPAWQTFCATQGNPGATTTQCGCTATENDYTFCENADATTQDIYGDPNTKSSFCAEDSANPPSGWTPDSTGWCSDCNASDGTKWQLGNFYGDGDGDGFYEEPLIEVCYGTNTPAGYSETFTDCAPDNPARWQEGDFTLSVDEDSACMTAEENNYCYGDSSATYPNNYILTSSCVDLLSLGCTLSVDCNDDDNSVGCQRSLYVDSDNDHYTVGNAVSVCTNGGVPSGYEVSRSATDDCNDAVPSRYILGDFSKSLDGDKYCVDNDPITNYCYGDAGTEPNNYRLKSTCHTNYDACTSSVDCNDGVTDQWCEMKAYEDKDADNYKIGNELTFCTDGVLPADRTKWASLETPVVDDCNDNIGNANIYWWGDFVIDNDGDTYYNGTEITDFCYGSSTSTYPSTKSIKKVDCAGYSNCILDCDDNVDDCNNPSSASTANCDWLLYLNTDGDGFCDDTITSIRGCDNTNPLYNIDDVSKCTDCANSDPNKWVNGNFYEDIDGDTYTVGVQTQVCYGSPNPPTGWVTTQSATDDCNDTPGNDNIYWNGTFYQDLDWDTHCVDTKSSPDPYCYGSNSNTWPPNFRISTGTDSCVDLADCDEYNASRWHYDNFCYDEDNDTYTTGVMTPVCYGDPVPPPYWQLVCSIDPDCSPDDPFTNVWKLGYRDYDYDTFSNSSSFIYACFPQGSMCMPNTNPLECYTPQGDDDCNDYEAIRWMNGTFVEDHDDDLFFNGVTHVDYCYGNLTPPDPTSSIPDYFIFEDQCEGYPSCILDCADNQNLCNADFEGDNFSCDWRMFYDSDSDTFCDIAASPLTVRRCDAAVNTVNPGYDLNYDSTTEDVCNDITDLNFDCDDDNSPSCNNDRDGPLNHCDWLAFQDVDADDFCNATAGTVRRCDASYPYIFEGLDDRSFDTKDVNFCADSIWSDCDDTVYDCNSDVDGPMNACNWLAFEDVDRDHFCNATTAAVRRCDATGDFNFTGRDGFRTFDEDAQSFCGLSPWSDCDDNVASCNNDYLGNNFSCDWLNFYDGDVDGFCNTTMTPERRCDAVSPYTVDLNTKSDLACAGLDADCDDNAPACNSDRDFDDSCDWLNFYDGDVDGFCNTTMTPERRCDAVSPYTVDLNTKNPLACVGLDADCDDNAFDCNSDRDFDDSCDWLNFYDGDRDTYCNGTEAPRRRCDAPTANPIWDVDLNTKNPGACNITTPFYDCDDTVDLCNGDRLGEFRDCSYLAFKDLDGDYYCNATAVPLTQRRCDAEDPYNFTGWQGYPITFNTIDPNYCGDSIWSDCDDSVPTCTDDCSTSFYADRDYDGYGILTDSHRYCDANPVYINDTHDCDDTKASNWDQARWVIKLKGTGPAIAIVDQHGIIGFSGNATTNAAIDENALPTSFKIRDSDGNVVSVITQDGDFYLEGSLNDIYDVIPSGDFDIRNQTGVMGSFTDDGNANFWCAMDDLANSPKPLI